MVEESELEDESKELEAEKETGVTAEMAKKVDPSEGCSW